MFYDHVIGKQFTFDQMQEAHRYVDTRHKVGSAVVRVCEDTA